MTGSKDAQSIKAQKMGNATTKYLEAWHKVWEIESTCRHWEQLEFSDFATIREAGNCITNALSSDK